MKKVVSGLFTTYQEADDAIRALYADGYNNKNISVIGQAEVLSRDGDHSQTAEDAGKGAGIGGIVGLIAGAVPFAIPGIGPIIGAGSIITGGFTGAGVGATTGGIVGMLRASLGKGDHVQQMEDAIKQGHVLVAVRTASTRRDIVNQTLRDYGAYQVHAHARTEEERMPILRKRSKYITLTTRASQQ